MAYSNVYGVDYGPGYTCTNCGRPSGYQGHAFGDGFSCTPSPEYAAELEAARLSAEARARNAALDEICECDLSQTQQLKART
jgi:hypothetical protein